MMETLQTLFQDYGAELGTAIWTHTLFVLVAVAFGFAAGLLGGILLSRVPKLSGVIMTRSSAVCTVLLR